MTVEELIQSYRLPTTTDRPLQDLRPAPSFQSLLAAFLATMQPKPSYRAYCCLSKQQFSTWQAMPTFNQIEDWHRALIHTPHQANKALAMLNTLFRWAGRRGLFTGQNPASGVKQFKKFSRDRVMSQEEVQTIVRALPHLQPKLAALVCVLLTTGCRLSEALRTQWTDVAFDSGRWRQAQTKTGKPHVTYLPRQARAFIQALPHETPWIFQGIIDQHYSVSGTEYAWNLIRRELRMTDVRLHDFRRTLASHLYAATKDDYLVKRCLNHANPSVTAIYVRITDEEVRQALQAQADRFCSAGQGAVVLPALTQGTEERIRYGRDVAERTVTNGTLHEGTL
jgi:integrase